MTTEQHDEVAAYALHALDEDEAGDFERHLERCAVCAAELTGLLDAAAALALDAEPAAPEPELRERILAIAAPAHQAKVVPLRRRWALPAAGALAAAAAAVAIGIGLWAASLSGSLASERSAHRADARALAIVSHPAATRYPLTGARGAVVVTPARDAALVVLRLNRAPKDKTFELWVVEGGKPVPAGLFRGGGAQTIVALDRTVPRTAQVAVSLERAGGSATPTTLLFGTQTA